MKMNLIAVNMMGMACMCPGFSRSFFDSISISDAEALAA